jgi:polyisoprenoid-binding protein YceI
MEYEVTCDGSHFTVQFFVTGPLAISAPVPTVAVRDFAGRLRFAPGAIEQSAFQLSINANSLEIGDDETSQEIERQMREKVLETAQYPRISFQSTRLWAEASGPGAYRLRTVGDLSLHGVTRPHEIAANLDLADDWMRLHGSFSLLQSHYGIKRIAVLGGMIVVKDELRFAFDLLGRKAK